MMTITTTEYGNLQQAFDHLNQELFEGKLPQCLITLQCNDDRTFGYYKANKFHHIRRGGRFEQACQKLFATGFKLNWQSVTKRTRFGSRATGVPSGGRDEFTCPKCGLNAQAKPSAALICGVCYHKAHAIHVTSSCSSGDDFSDWTDEELAGLSLTLGG